mmetsp:Transcript_3207/g.8040  ORF Transcript_3207/g.8040 Transcript_3207/m.8040 type:complete len:80 (+) Transcript_3207:139-378(+)
MLAGTTGKQAFKPMLARGSQLTIRIGSEANPQGIDRRACGGALGMVELGLVPVVGQNLSDGDGEVATICPEAGAADLVD